MRYIIQIDLNQDQEPAERWYTVADCQTPEAAGEVLRFLLSHGTNRTYRIERLTEPALE